MKPGRLVLLVLSLGFAFWAGRASMIEYEMLARSPGGVSIEMLDLPAKHLGLTISCWVILVMSLTLGIFAIRQPRTITSISPEKDDHAQAQG